jgi:hypothetical protein
MPQPLETRSSLGSLLRKCLSSPLLDWLALIVALYRQLRQFITHEAHEGMYEVLDYDTTLELVDPRGETAIFKKRQRIKFLQDNVLAFQDYAWGDGDIFGEYKCSPGVEVDRYQEGDRWNILISLRETKSAGDVEDFYIDRTVKGGFTQAEESRQVEVRHRMRHLRVAVIFPKKRRCQRAVLVERSRNKTVVLDERHFADLPDGRQVVSWETSKIRRFEVYTLKWRW